MRGVHTCLITMCAASRMDLICRDGVFHAWMSEGVCMRRDNLVSSGTEV